MNDEDLAVVRAELEAFVADVFVSLRRSDQRAKGGLYLRGLMLDGQRKSMQPMAQRLQVDHQQLQQFISSSSWAVEPVRRRLADIAIEAIAPHAWVIDDTGFPKDGPASAGVARQYSGSLGKIGNCQIGVSVNAVTDAASAPLNWRLFLPKSWDDTKADTQAAADRIVKQRIRAGVPEGLGHQPKWRQAVEMIDQLATWGQHPPVVVADAGYGDSTGFRQALTDRQIPYVVAVKAATSAYPAEAVPNVMAYSGRGPRPTTPRYHDKPVSLRDLAGAAGRKQLRQVTWRHGTKPRPGTTNAALRSRFLTLPVRPANHTIPTNADGSLPQRWLIAQWPPHASEPTDYWLADMPPDTPIKTLVRLAKIRWRIEHDYRELKHGLGLDHFEGRSFIGWHRHVTLVTAAHVFITTMRVTHPKASGTT